MAKQVIYTDKLMRPIAHFSHAVRVGGTLHLGATAGTDAHRRLAGVTPGMIDVEAQVEPQTGQRNVTSVIGCPYAG